MSVFFFFNDTATTEIYTLSLHDALPISLAQREGGARLAVHAVTGPVARQPRCERPVDLEAAPARVDRRAHVAIGGVSHERSRGGRSERLPGAPRPHTHASKPHGAGRAVVPGVSGMTHG